MSKATPITPWPTLPWFTKAEMAAIRARPNGEQILWEAREAREQQIALEKENPLEFGYEITPGWKDADQILAAGCRDLLVLGGRRSSKTEYAAKRVVKTAMTKPGARIQCWSQNITTSIDRQQSYIHRYLPPWLRPVKKFHHPDRGMIKISYGRVTGFTENVALVGNDSVIRFFTYQAFRNDPTLAEGAELDLCWLDEMAPVKLVDTMRFCLVSRGGILLQTFTPMEGYTQTVAQYLDGSEVEEWRLAELLPGFRLNGKDHQGMMPYKLRCFNRTRKAMFFFSQDNPYPPGNYERLKKDLEGAAQEVILTKGYGWPTKRYQIAIRKFSEKVNVIPHDSVPKEMTRYLFADPGGAKNWFIVWLGIDLLGRIFCYREWPDITLGEWALPGGSTPGEQPDGVEGPAQRAGSGGGVHTYKRLMIALENGEDIFARCIDPRPGNSPVPGKEASTTLISLMLEITPASTQGPEIPPMVFEPWPACSPDDTADLLAPWMDYNDQAPVTAQNCPKFYISERCQNTIFALKVWTGLDGEKGKTKDPIDCLRGAAKRGLDYITPQMLLPRGGGWGY